MKKLSLLFIIGLLIVSCGKDYEVYTKEKKKEMYIEALTESKKGNNEKKEKIHELMQKTSIAAKNGDNEAYTEYREWTSVIHEVASEKNIPTEKADLLKRKW